MHSLGQSDGQASGNTHMTTHCIPAAVPSQQGQCMEAFLPCMSTLMLQRSHVSGGKAAQATFRPSADLSYHQSRPHSLAQLHALATPAVQATTMHAQAPHLITRGTLALAAPLQPLRLELVQSLLTAYDGAPERLAIPWPERGICCVCAQSPA